MLGLGLALGGAVVQAQEPALRTWEVDGVQREALVYAPSKKSDGKAPLVSTGGGTARHAGRTHHFHETWPEAIVVYMQGLNTPGKLTDPEGKKSGWQSGPGDQRDRDLKFFDAVLASMKTTYRCIPRHLPPEKHGDLYCVYYEDGAFGPCGCVSITQGRDGRRKVGLVRV